MPSFQPSAKPCTIRVAVAGVTAALVAGNAALAEPFDLLYDLRVHGSGAKMATVSLPGDEVVIDLYAVLYGVNQNPRDEWLQSGIGRVISSTGGLLGDLSGLSAPSPFNSHAAIPGRQFDLDGDGDLEIGNIDPTNADDFYTYRASPPVQDIPAGGFHVGQFRFSAKSAGEGQSTQIQYQMRETDSGVLFWVDDRILDGMTGRIAYGQPVTISFLPSSGGEAQYLSGTINDHVTISRLTKPAPGTTLVLARGLDVVSGGTLDMRDGLGGYGAHEVRIEDATSGNSGGAINAGALYVGRSGSGTFTQSAGSTRAATLSVGHDATGVGTLNVTGGDISATTLTVGNAGSGLYDQIGGAASADRLVLAEKSGATGTIELRGGAASLTAHAATIGAAGAATLRLRSGAMSFGSDLTLGAAATGSGVMEISGGTLNAGFAHVGREGTARVTQTGGRAVFSHLYLASSSSANGSNAGSAYTLDGGTIIAGATTVGEHGSGLFVQNGGTFETGNYLDVTSQSGTARFELKGGSLNGDGLIVAYNLGQGEFVQSGGQSRFQNVSVGSRGRIRYEGGSLLIWGSYRGHGEFDFASAPVTLMAANGTFLDFSNTTLKNTSNASILAGPGSLVQFPAGFDADAAFENIDTQGIVHFAGQRLVVSANNVIGGTGAIEGDVQNSGVVSPGNSPGTLEIIGSYTQSDTGSLHIELSGTNADLFDLLSVTEGAAIDGRLTVALLGEFVPSPNDRFEILVAEALTGLFDNAADKISLPQGTFDVIYTADSVTLANFAAVPEPAAAMIIALPLLLARRRRRMCLA